MDNIDIAVFYTVWSYAKGARRKMVLETAEYLKKERGIKRFVTLSPHRYGRKIPSSNGATSYKRAMNAPTL